MTPYYSDESVTLYHGDCLEVMAAMPNESVDLVFTSPPYNLGNSSGGGMSSMRAGRNSLWTGKASIGHGYDSHQDAMPYSEYIDWQKQVLTECWRLIRPTGAIFYQHKPRVQNGLLQTPLDLNPDLPVRQIVIWDRYSGMNFGTTHYVPMHEWIVIFAGPEFRLKSQGASGLGDIWRAAPVSGSEHPAPFPVSLPTRAIESTGARMVLDPFVGSGTTLRAAANAGVQGIGIDTSESYCKMTVARLAQGVLQFD